MQRLNVSHLRGRTETCTGAEEVDSEKKNETGADKEKKAAESTEEVCTSDRVRLSGKGGRVKMNKADRKKKAKTKTCSDVVKGLKIEDELETTNSDKSRNELEIADLVEQFDSEKPNHVKAEVR